LDALLCRHKKNEVFLDVVESVNLLVNSNGTLVLSEVSTATQRAAVASQWLSRGPEAE
jgi:AP-1 complex subunit mu